MSDVAPKDVLAAATFTHRHPSGHLIVRHHDSWCVMSATGEKVLKRCGSIDEAIAWCDERWSEERAASQRREVRLLGAIGVIRTAEFQGVPHLVVPVVALVGDIAIWPVNAPAPEFVPVDVLAAAPQGWNGRACVDDHPKDDDGRNITANSPRTLERSAFGTVFDARFERDRLLMDAWIDPARASKLGDSAARTVERLQAGEIVEVSVGCYVTLQAQNGVDKNGRAYTVAWETLVPDHLAFLREGDRGACSAEAGCGAGRAAAHHLVTAEGMRILDPELRAAGSVPKNVSTALAPRGTAWSRPSLGDFTSKSWGELSAAERRSIAGHFAWTANSPPESYGDLKLPHHRPSDGKVVFLGVTQAIGRLNQSDIPGGDRGRVRAHLEAHRDAFNAEQKAAGSGEEDSMNRQERIAALIANPHARLKPEHQSRLEKATDDQLLVLEQNAELAAADERRKGSVFGLLKSLFATRTAGERDMSDSELRQAVDEALRAEEPGYMGIAELWPWQHEVVYLVAPTDEWQLMRRGYSIADDGKAALGDNRQQVQATTTFEPVSAAVERKHGEAACGCGGARQGAAASAQQGGTMTAEQKAARAARIKALIDSPHTPFGADDQAHLESQTDERLSTLEQHASSAKANAEAKAAADTRAEQERQAAAQAQQQQQQPPQAAASAPSLTAEAWLAAAPPEVRSLITRQRTQERERKVALVSRLKTAQAEFTEPELQEMPVDQLERIARLANADADLPPILDTDYSGRGAHRAAARNEDVYANPPNGYDIALRAMKSGQAADGKGKES